jgi:hypothetical protein
MRTRFAGEAVENDVGERARRSDDAGDEGDAEDDGDEACASRPGDECGREGYDWTLPKKHALILLTSCHIQHLGWVNGSLACVYYVSG